MRRCLLVPPVPRPFDFGFTAKRPLVPLAAVAMFLNKSAREVLALIEDGKLRWAFDIRSAKASRREVRVLRQSLFEYAGLFAKGEILPEAEKGEFAKIMDSLLAEGVVLSPANFHLIPSKLCTRTGRSFHNQLRLKARSVSLLRKQVLPKEPLLRGTEIARCFSCLNQHVLNLIKEKSLRTINLRRGPKASPLVPRASVIEFLEKRRMS
ncbi:MAG TPA: hypothetical protein VFC07_08330 [Verrucomicrobiae bacterium]|nr:hypothetical protein [Verrucomicrobiae bacterium]